MRVVLVGPADGRARLRHALPAGIEIVGEAATLAAARSSASDADAWLVVADDADGADGPMVEPLTPRERDVLELIAQGLPNKAIAARLAISDQTVKVHLGSIYGKLQASNRTDAVRRAIRRGLVSV
jgi:two-component system, NarL family, nitrate/nitrite response regulator NarL